MRGRVVVTLWALLAGCAAPATAMRKLGPLVDEGEVYLYLQPFPQEAGRLSFSVQSVTAVSAEGTQTPLELVLPSVAGHAVKYQTLLAWGRLPHDDYVGFDIKVAKATLASDDGLSELLVPPEPARVEASFRLERRRATVWSLSFRYAESVGKSFSFAPVFSALIPARTAGQVVAYCSNTGLDNLTLLDKRLKQVTSVMPAGRGPKGVVLDPSGNRAYVALSDEDQVQVIDMIAGAEIARVRLSGGDRPRELALAPGGKLLVSTNPGSNTVSFIDPVAGLELSRLPAGEEPSAILLDRRGRRAYVFNRRSSNVTVLDLANRSVVSTIATDPEPLRGQLNAAGTRLYVIAAGSAYMTVYALPGQTVVGRVFIGLGTAAIKVDPRTELIYLAKEGERRVFVHDPNSFLPIDDFDIPDGTSYMAIEDLENTLWLLLPERRSIAVVDLTSRKMLGTMDVGSLPYQVAIVGERF
jgi:YVTN family beta-propeller protein